MAEQDAKKENASRPKLGLTVGTKLIALIATLLAASSVTLVVISTRMFTEDNTALIQQMNSDTAAGLSTQVRDNLESAVEKARVVGKTLQKTSAGSQIGHELFEEDKNFLAVFLNSHSGGSVRVQTRAISHEMTGLGDSKGELLQTELKRNRDFALEQAGRGEVQVGLVKLADGKGAVAIAIPFVKSGSGFSKSLTAVIRQSQLSKSFADSGIVTSFLVTRQGSLIAHRDAGKALSGENVAYLPVVKQLTEGRFGNGQTRYVDPTSNEAKLGAFHVVGLGGLGVVAEVPEAKAFEAARRVQFRAILVCLIVLSISFLAGFLYSGTITWPLRQLVEAAHRIAQGDFKVTLKPKGRDEVAHLSLAFNDMAKGLEERDRVKETFNKFHNKEIAEKLLSGEVKLGGERKEATIFFSDVRGFTAMSESMEPEQVVEMLNEYMTCMVSVIRAHGGIVDKYVGDAIMALWGVPIGGPNDAANALNACLAMRVELAKLNTLRISRGQNALKIGMGLNSGPVIAGNIGSNEKMEYTVIGDTVNLASRMESMTKEYGSDLLIPKVIHDKLKGQFIFEPCKSAKVKGKTTAIEIFKVRGYIENGQEVIVQTPYSSYESEKSDKVVHDEAA